MSTLFILKKKTDPKESMIPLKIYILIFIGCMKSSESDSEKARVLILCEDIGTSYQLQQFLTQGGSKLLLMEALKNDVNVSKISNKLLPPSKKKDSEVKNKETDDFLESIRESFQATQNTPELEILETTLSVIPESDTKDYPLITIQTLKSDEDRGECILLEEIFCRIQPQFIVMYHYNVSAIRQIEIFEARQRRKVADRLKVFFLIHPNTVEEQAYLTSLRREKQAFELLIETKRTMVIPEYQDGKSAEEIPQMNQPSTSKIDNILDLKACVVQKVVESPKVIVDMREFRSQLPCLLHRKGFEVLPVTIIVGDYILTPDVCVERKSISDLIGSLNSGRLYTQCIQMHRNYQTPVLLIEFDQHQPFHLQGLSMLSTTSSGTGSSVNTAIMQKLQLLTIHFHKLRIIWSPSPYASVLLIEKIKKNKLEPDSKTALKQGTEEADGGNVAGLHIDKFNTNVFDFMIKMPGISYKNIHRVMNRKMSLKELLNEKPEELEKLIDSKRDSDAFLSAVNFTGATKITKSVSTATTAKYSRYRNIV